MQMDQEEFEQVGAKLEKQQNEKREESKQDELTQKDKQSKDNETQQKEDKKDKKYFIKCKVAIFFGYNGSQFCGLQFQKDNHNTVEEQLIQAIYHADLIAKGNINNMKALQWGRGARTDKGVHAIVNCVNCNIAVPKIALYFNEEESMQQLSQKSNTEIIAQNIQSNNQKQKKKKQANNQISSEKNFILWDNVIKVLNSNLPTNTIRVFAVKFVSGGFQVRQGASTRLYEYLAPLFLFRRLPAQQIKQNEENLQMSLNQNAVTVNKETHQTNVENKISANESEPIEKAESDEEVIVKVNALLQEFKGTHNFHNFAKDVKYTDGNAKRHMISLKAELVVPGKDVCNSDGAGLGNGNFVLIQIQGQSFMYHQIRKMMGFLMESLQYHLPSVYRQNSFMRNVMRIWLAPPDGLMLHRITFEKYHIKRGIPEKLIFNEQQESTIAEFKTSVLYPFIMQKELTEQPFRKWYDKMLTKYQDDGMKSSDEEDDDDQDEKNKGDD